MIFSVQNIHICPECKDITNLDDYCKDILKIPENGEGPFSVICQCSNNATHYKRKKTFICTVRDDLYVLIYEKEKV